MVPRAPLVPPVLPVLRAPLVLPVLPELLV